MAEYSEDQRNMGAAAGGFGTGIGAFKIATLILAPIAGPFAPALASPIALAGAIYGGKKGYKSPKIGAASAVLAITPIPAILDAADEGVKVLDETLGNPKVDVVKYKV